MLHVVDPTGSGRTVAPGEVPLLMLIASRCYGYGELISDSKNTVLIGIGDSRAIADALLIYKYSDCGLWMQDMLAQQARGYATETFDLRA
jgi:hypothetical protein